MSGVRKLFFFSLFGLYCCLIAATAVAEEYPVLPPGSYENNPDIAGECLPKYQWPVFGQPCRNVKTRSGNSRGTGESSENEKEREEKQRNTSGGAKLQDSNLEFLRQQGALNEGNEGGGGEGSSTGSDEGGSSGSGGDEEPPPECPGPNDPPAATVEKIECDSHQKCTKDCQRGEKVCAAYGLSDNQCVCLEFQTPEDCRCEPKCEIADPVNYPYCCKVEDKPGYPCMKICTLPNGDKVDIPENPPRCKKFKECCYGHERDKNDPNPVETERGDPRDYCKLKCVDVCNDKQFVPRAKTASDIFPECCTPPVPIRIACACCREPQSQPSPGYCEYFFRFFNCDTAKMQCPEDAEQNQCKPSVPAEPAQYDPNYDAFLEFDPRFNFCSGDHVNRNCRYVCRGRGILTAAEAPTDGIWAKDYVDAQGPVENNYPLEVHGNCAVQDKEVKDIPWPPKNQALETCDGE